MFQLLVSYSGWTRSRGTIPAGRAFEYTDELLVERFKPSGDFKFSKLLAVPALFVNESTGEGEQHARVGSLTRARKIGKELSLEYVFDDGIPSIANKMLERLAGELDIDAFEFTRTHWAVKDVDLFRVLVRGELVAVPSPKVFRLEGLAGVSESLVAVMMPFKDEFSPVFETIRAAAGTTQMACLRADDLWQNEAIIQDVVSLINSARVVICDCTGRNPNVFYETGIAHTLGRDVILITQESDDVPFDVGHLRHVSYSNTVPGRKKLAEQIARRLRALQLARSAS